MHTLLFLDDDPLRQSLFKENFKDIDLLHPTTAKEAIHLIKEHLPDILSLDHDLGSEDSGMDVVNFLVSFETYKPLMVIIHSCNPVGAKSMYDTLKDAEINVERISLVNWGKLILQLKMLIHKEQEDE